EAKEIGGAPRGAPAISSFSAAQPRTTLPALMHEVHTLRRLRWDTPTLAWTVWMFGFHRRLVRRWECETDLPKPGPLPQTSHTAATSNSSTDQGKSKLNHGSQCGTRLSDRVATLGLTCGGGELDEAS